MREKTQVTIRVQIEAGGFNWTEIDSNDYTILRLRISGDIYLMTREKELRELELILDG